MTGAITWLIKECFLVLALIGETFLGRIDPLGGEQNTPGAEQEGSTPLSNTNYFCGHLVSPKFLEKYFKVNTLREI